MPVYKEPSLSIRGTPGIVQHEILNNRRHVLTKVSLFCMWLMNLLFLIRLNCLLLYQKRKKVKLFFKNYDFCNLIMDCAFIGYCWYSEVVGDH